MPNFLTVPPKKKGERENIEKKREKERERRERKERKGERK